MSVIAVPGSHFRNPFICNPSGLNPGMKKRCGNRGILAARRPASSAASFVAAVLSGSPAPWIGHITVSSFVRKWPSEFWSYIAILKCCASGAASGCVVRPPLRSAVGGLSLTTGAPFAGDSLLLLLPSFLFVIYVLLDD